MPSKKEHKQKANDLLFENNQYFQLDLFRKQTNIIRSYHQNIYYTF